MSHRDVARGDFALRQATRTCGSSARLGNTRAGNMALGNTAVIAGNYHTGILP